MNGGLQSADVLLKVFFALEAAAVNDVAPSAVVIISSGAIAVYDVAVDDVAVDDVAMDVVLVGDALWMPVLRSRHFFGRLRTSKVPEPTPAPIIKSGSGSRHKKGGSRRLRLLTLKF